jgi:hypothetical protein
VIAVLHERKLAGQPLDVSQGVVGAGEIGGVVRGRFGPEAGVWVIAEIKEPRTRFAQMVVTDDHGRYLIPDLPKAKYQVWVRSYGLIDSSKIESEPRKVLNLTAVVAPDGSSAAQYYPAIYWFSMLKVPNKSKFPGTGPNGNGTPVEFKSQDQWLDVIKTNGCGNCHQIGNYATRNIPAAFAHSDSSTRRGRAVCNPAPAAPRWSAQWDRQPSLPQRPAPAISR